MQDFNSLFTMFYYTSYQKIGNLFFPFMFLDFRTNCSGGGTQHTQVHYSGGIGYLHRLCASGNRASGNRASRGHHFLKTQIFIFQNKFWIFFYLIERVISKSRGQILYRRSWSRGESPCRTPTRSSTAGWKSTCGTTVGRKLLGHWLAWILWSWRRPENKDCLKKNCFAFILGLLVLSLYLKEALS